MNYIIATYSGNKMEYNLQIHLQNLYTSIMRDNIKYLQQVTLVCPKVQLGHKEKEFYYQKDTWLKLFEKTKVKLVYMDYFGDNNSASYDQWIQAYLAYPDFEYFLFIEDDYCIHTSVVDFDSVYIEYYKNKVKDYNNIGYVCTLASELHGIKHHAAISNGMMNKDTLVKLGDNLLEDFYKIAKQEYCQTAFSILFDNKNIQMISMHNDFVAWFWLSSKQKILNYSNENVKKLFFIPVEYFFYPYFNQNHIPTQYLFYPWNSNIRSTNMNYI